jgi:hypothetical protein
LSCPTSKFPASAALSIGVFLISLGAILAGATAIVGA